MTMNYEPLTAPFRKVRHKDQLLVLASDGTVVFRHEYSEWWDAMATRIAAA